MSAAHDELFQLMLGRTTTKAVERILAAGWVKPRTITTVEELAELANGSVIRDKFEDVNERRDGKWCGYEQAPLSDRSMGKYLPATVLHEGQA